MNVSDIAIATVAAAAISATAAVIVAFIAHKHNTYTPRDASLLDAVNNPSVDCSGNMATSVVSHKRLELFSLYFSHSGAGATGLDPLQGLFAPA